MLLNLSKPNQVLIKSYYTKSWPPLFSSGIRPDLVTSARVETELPRPLRLQDLHDKVPEHGDHQPADQEPHERLKLRRSINMNYKGNRVQWPWPCYNPTLNYKSYLILLLCYGQPSRLGPEVLSTSRHTNGLSGYFPVTRITCSYVNCNNLIRSEVP